MGGTSGEKNFGGGRRLSQVELQDMSKKGLCFKCGDKWDPKHKYKFKHNQLILLKDYGDSSGE